MKIGITDIATSNLIASTECWGGAGLLSLNDRRSHFCQTFLVALSHISFGHTSMRVYKPIERRNLNELDTDTCNDSWSSLAGF